MPRTGSTLLPPKQAGPIPYRSRQALQDNLHPLILDVMKDYGESARKSYIKQFKNYPQSDDPTPMHFLNAFGIHFMEFLLPDHDLINDKRIKIPAPEWYSGLQGLSREIEEKKIPASYNTVKNYIFKYINDLSLYKYYDFRFRSMTLPNGVGISNAIELAKYGDKGALASLFSIFSQDAPFLNSVLDIHHKELIAPSFTYGRKFIEIQEWVDSAYDNKSRWYPKNKDGKIFEYPQVFLMLCVNPEFLSIPTKDLRDLLYILEIDVSLDCRNFGQRIRRDFDDLKNPAEYPLSKKHFAYFRLFLFLGSL